MSETIQYDAYYLSYSGTQLPLNLVSPITGNEIQNRNTYFAVKKDEEGRICLIHKRVYGDIELSHQYQYHANGVLKSANIHSIDDERIQMTFDTDGDIVSREEFDEVFSTD